MAQERWGVGYFELVVEIESKRISDTDITGCAPRSRGWRHAASLDPLAAFDALVYTTGGDRERTRSDLRSTPKVSARIERVLFIGTRFSILYTSKVNS